MSIFLGSDTACTIDLPLVDVQITNPAQLIGQRIARLLQIPRGALGLINDDPDRGYDVRQLVNARLRPGDVSAAQSAIRSECLKDEEVLEATVSLTQANGNVSIAIKLVSSSGPFSLTLNVQDLTVEAVFSF